MPIDKRKMPNSTDSHTSSNLLVKLSLSASDPRIAKVVRFGSGTVLADELGDPASLSFTAGGLVATSLEGSRLVSLQSLADLASIHFTAQSPPGRGFDFPAVIATATVGQSVLLLTSPTSELSELDFNDGRLQQLGTVCDNAVGLG